MWCWSCWGKRRKANVFDLSQVMWRYVTVKNWRPWFAESQQVHQCTLIFLSGWQRLLLMLTKCVTRLASYPYLFDGGHTVWAGCIWCMLWQCETAFDDYIFLTSSARTSRGRKFQRKKTISQRKNLPIECAQGDRPARCPNHFFAVNEPSAVPWWWCFVLWSEVFWCLDVCCGVRSCDGHVIWCDVMACVVSCHVMQCDVMEMSCTTPVLLCTTKYYSSTTLFYKVLLQYYPVLQSTTQVLPKYYSSTNLYYKVLLCTTKYYSST